MTIKELMNRFENIADAEARWTAMAVAAELCGEKVASTGGVQKSMTFSPAPKKRTYKKHTKKTPTSIRNGAWDWEDAGLVGETIVNKDTGCRFYIASRYKKDGMNFVGMAPGFEQKYDMSSVHNRFAHDTIYNGGVQTPGSPFKWIIESSGVSLGRHLHAKRLFHY